MKKIKLSKIKDGEVYCYEHYDTREVKDHELDALVRLGFAAIGVGGEDTSADDWRKFHQALEAFDFEEEA